MSDEELDDPQVLRAKVEQFRDRCKEILGYCDQQWKHVVGIYRYKNSLSAEAQFLEKLLENPDMIKKEYVHSTNMSYLEAVHETMTETRQITEVMQLFSVPPDNKAIWMSRAALMRNRSVKVDLVAEQGLAWIKVIARNAKALRHDMAGLEFGEDSDSEAGLVYDDDDDEDDDGELTAEDAFDQLPIFKKARDYLRSAEAHEVHFRAPRVVFAFKRLHPKETEDVNQILDRLRDMGIVVYIQGQGTLLDAYGGPLAPDHGCLSTQRVNLDVSTVLALISEMSHHPCRPDQVEGEALQLQAEREATSAVLPVLDSLLRDKSLFMVQTAYDRLTNIVQVVGGDKEKARFRYVFEGQGDSHGLENYHICVVPDAPSERFRRLLEPPPQKEKLNNGRKIRSRFSEFHAVIFGTGDTNRMTTITAIQWMQTALTDAGLTGVAIVCHEPRSLSEQKMTV